jgi:hypothetical protein
MQAAQIHPQTHAYIQPENVLPFLFSIILLLFSDHRLSGDLLLSTKKW